MTVPARRERAVGETCRQRRPALGRPEADAGQSGQGRDREHRRRRVGDVQQQEDGQAPERRPEQVRAVRQADRERAARQGRETTTPATTNGAASGPAPSPTPRQGGELHDAGAAGGARGSRTNAVRGRTRPLDEGVCPIGGFSEPEYARVGLTESNARSAHDVVVATVRFDETTRTIIDGRTDGFCKLIIHCGAHTIVGCSVVGDRAVEIVQVVAIAMSSGARVEDLARISLSFPTYAGAISRAAYRACEQLGVDTSTWNQPGDAYGH